MTREIQANNCIDRLRQCLGLQQPGTTEQQLQLLNAPPTEQQHQSPDPNTAFKNGFVGRER